VFPGMATSIGVHITPPYINSVSGWGLAGETLTDLALASSLTLMHLHKHDFTNCAYDKTDADR
jgi:hypothetical protein